MSEVDVTIEKGVAVVTIDRPHARNAIGLRTMSELGDALDQVTSAGAAVVVLRGAGERAFVSGGDLKELGAIRDEQGAIDMATRMRRLLDRLATLPIPVIAALNGHALGGGAEVTVAADIRVAADDVKTEFTQVQLAIMPAHHHPSLESGAVRAFARLWLSEEHWNAVRRLDGSRRQAATEVS